MRGAERSPLVPPKGGGPPGRVEERGLPAEGRSPATPTGATDEGVPVGSRRPLQLQAAAACACALLVVVTACHRESAGTTIRVVDLLRQIGHAETRPLNGAFVIAEHTFGGRSRASLVVPVPSRITWKH